MENKKRVSAKIKVDKKLDRFSQVNLFEKKLEMANEIIKRVGIPSNSK